MWVSIAKKKQSSLCDYFSKRALSKEEDDHCTSDVDEAMEFAGYDWKDEQNDVGTQLLKGNFAGNSPEPHSSTTSKAAIVPASWNKF